MHRSSLLAVLALAADAPPTDLGSGQGASIVPLPAPAALARLGVQRARTVNGPFSVPGMMASNTSDDNGMGTFQERANLPCRDCYITGFSFGLEYPDGSYANVNTSMYLHHAVLLNMNRTDATCPHGSGNLQRMFGAGNERGHADLTLNGTRKAGYYVGPDDTVGLVAEIMNLLPEARQVVVTATWDYVAASANNTSATAGFASAFPVWLDIDGSCGSFTNGSEVAVPADAGAFSYAMPAPWSPAAGAANKTATYDVLVAASHLHDGGLQLDIVKNGQLVCEGYAKYGETPGYISTVPDDGMGGMPGMEMAAASGASGELTHISSIHLCAGVGTTTSDDKWTVTAHYNLTAHPGMETTTGAVKPIMGIGILFLVEA